MLRADMLAESYVPSDEIRTLRDLVRTRKALVEERTAEKTASGLSSSGPTTPTIASCSAQRDESSWRNSL